MGRLSHRQADRAGLHRDLIWVLLWQQSYDLGDGRWFRWVTSSQIHELWLGDNERAGYAFHPEFIKRDAITRHLNRLVEDGRAVVSRAPGRHPRYQALRLPYDCPF